MGIPNSRIYCEHELILLRNLNMKSDWNFKYNIAVILFQIWSFI
jgi:hypothetical protein